MEVVTRIAALLLDLGVVVAADVGLVRGDIADRHLARQDGLYAWFGREEKP